MNIDFSLDPTFSWYVVLLLISGLLTLIVGLVPASGLSVGWRVLTVIAGLAFFGYGVYLAFFFEGERYTIIFKAFIVPIALLVNFFRSLSNRKKGGAPVPPQAGYPVPPQAGYPVPPQAGYPVPQQPGAPVPPQAGYPVPQQPGAPVPPAAAPAAPQTAGEPSA
ncbi:hypothetical protein [Kitasatospora sp. NPDC004272]